jgi:hypothetical protein
MSFSFSGTNGLRVTGLTLSDLATPAEITVGCWVKTSGQSGSHWLGEVREGDTGDARATLRLDTTMTPSLNVSDVNATGAAFAASTVSDNTWTHVYGYLDDAGNTVYAGHTSTNGTGESRTNAWPADALTCIKIGMYYEGGDFFIPAAKVALFYIASRKPSGAELTALAGGDHPQAVFGADLVDYWPPDSKTSGINGWVLSDITSTVTIDTGDNPTVDDPPGGDVTVGASGSASTGGHGTASPVFSIGL